MNVFELFAKLNLDTSGYEKGLQGAEKDLRGFGSKVGGAFKTLAKVGTAAFGALATGTAAITKQAVDAYGEYEQLAGGMDALFGKQTSKIVKKNAGEAWKTAGLSANKYLETTTAFAASLIKSTGGDTKKAANLADVAIQDMGDNVNRFGTSIDNLQAAYKNFSRENYTMLDNLSLGYSGSAKGMYDLLTDAAKISKEFRRKADFSIDSKGHLTAEYSDMIEAIHIVQDNLNITGTTSKEAKKTLQGSASAAKAAWENLIAGVANDKVDFSKLINEFVDSTVQAGVNFIPRIEKALVGVGRLFNGLAKKVLPIIIKEIPKILPGLIKATFTLVNALIKGFAQNKDKLIKAGRKTIKIIWKELQKGAKTLLGKNASWDDLGDKLSDGLNKLVKMIDASKLGDVANKLITNAMNLLTSVIEGIDWGLIAQKIGDFIVGINPLEIGDNAATLVINIIDALTKSLSQSFAKKPLETSLGLLFADLTIGKGFLTKFVGKNFGKLGQKIANKIGGKLGDARLGKLKGAGKIMGSALGKAIAGVAAAYVGLNIGDAIGSELRKKYGSDAQQEDTGSLMEYLLLNGRSISEWAEEWKDAFEQAFIDEDSTLSKWFSAPLEGWKMIVQEIEDTIKNSTWYKALVKFGVIKTSGGAGHSFNPPKESAKDTKEKAKTTTTTTTKTTATTPESLSEKPTDKTTKRLTVNNKMTLKVGQQEVNGIIERANTQISEEYAVG